MNNINSQELTRTVVTESAKPQPGRDAAKAGSSSGKEVPTQQQGPAKATPPPEVNLSQERAEQVERAVAKLNDYVQSLQRDLRFSVDRELGRAVVSVIDRHSQEVIRQIPNETALRLARNLNDLNQTAKLDQQLNDVRNAGGAGPDLTLIDTRI